MCLVDENNYAFTLRWRGVYGEGVDRTKVSQMSHSPRSSGVQPSSGNGRANPLFARGDCVSRIRSDHVDANNVFRWRGDYLCYSRLTRWSKIDKSFDVPYIVQLTKRRRITDTRYNTPHRGQTESTGYKRD